MKTLFARFPAFGFILGISLLNATHARAASCTHFASPEGGGDGLSPATPFQIGDFMNIAGPGLTLCLLDGTYQGDNSMIVPREGVNGTPDAPITVQALNDG